MASNRYKIFKESILPPDFCQTDIQNIKKLINDSTSFSICSLPGLGISMFLKYLATQNFAYFIHLDINELESPTTENFFKLLSQTLNSPENNLQPLKNCENSLLELTKNQNRVVLIFNRFDRLKENYTKTFFNNLRSLRDIDKEKIIIIFATDTPLLQQKPDIFSGGSLNMYSKGYFLKPFSTEDLTSLLKINTPNLQTKLNEKYLKLSGGHYQLLQLLLKSDFQNFLEDPAILIQLKELFYFFPSSLRKQLQKISLNKPITPQKTLTDYGIIQNNILFTPLLSDFIKQNLRLNLPLKEAVLFKLLKSKLGQVVAKDELFQTIWAENSTEASDWALNSLIYRLRKNPTFLSKGYIIESYKKQGYILSKN